MQGNNWQPVEITESIFQTVYFQRGCAMSLYAAHILPCTYLQAHFNGGLFCYIEHSRVVSVTPDWIAT
jgi:hypothetical protein